MALAGLDRFTNSPQTTLSGNGGSVAAGATSMKVLSALPFPSQTTTFYRVLVENEIIMVTGGQGTTTWTIVRAMEGTAAAIHADGVAVTLMLSAWELNSFRQEFNVMAYGAVGDGAADDSTAFQNAVNDAHAQAVGGVVFLPTFSYKVISVLTTYSNVVFVTYGATLTGAGASSVTPLIKWSLVGGLTLPGTLTGSNGLTVSGGLTISSGGLTMAGGGTINGNLTVAPAQASGQIGFTVSPTAVSSVTAETIAAQDSAQTLTITGGYTTQRFRVLKQPTITAASALTITNAATLAIEGAPIAGGSAVLTNAWPFWVQAGTARFDGAVDVNAGLQVRGTGLASGGNAFAVTPPSVSSVIAETASSNHLGNTLTITGGYVTQRFNLFQQPTISAGSALTVTNAATLAIADAPTTGGSAIITNKFAFWVQAGTTKLDGPVVHSRNAADTIPVIDPSSTTATGVTVFVRAGTPSSPNEGDIWMQG